MLNIEKTTWFAAVLAVLTLACDVEDVEPDDLLEELDDDGEFRAQPGTASCKHFKKTVTHAGGFNHHTQQSCPLNKPHVMSCGCNIEDGVSSHAWLNSSEVSEANLSFNVPGGCDCETHQDLVGSVDPATGELIHVEYDVQTVVQCCNW